MNQALAAQIEQRIAARSLLKHPFYQAWQAGELTLDDLRDYAQQYYFFEAAFPRFLSAIHSRCDLRDVRQSILDNLWDEEHGVQNHRALWLDFCAGLGLERDGVESSEVAPETQALLDTYYRICNTGTFQEGLAAMYAYEQQVPQVALEKMSGLREFYGVSDEATLKFFEVHSVLDEDHSEREAEGILNHTDDAAASGVTAALQSALDAWWGFLDGVQARRPSLALAAD